MINTMKMLVLVLNDEDKIDDILLNLSKAGVKGATIIDSVGMGSILGVKIPFFKRLDNIVQIQKPDNKTIFAVIQDEEVLREAVSMLKDKLQLEKPGTGFMFILPVLEVYGTTEITKNE